MSPERIAVGQLHDVGGSIGPQRRGLVGEQELGPELPRLLVGAEGELVARDAGGKAEVVVDHGALPRLAAQGLTLEHHRAEALRRAVHRGRQSGRPGADDQQIALVGGRPAPHPERLRDVTVGRVDEDAAAEDDGHGQPGRIVQAGVPQYLPALVRVGLVEPVGDAVPPEQVAELVRARRPALADDAHGLVHRPLQAGPLVEKARHVAVEPLVRRRVPGLGDEELDLPHGAAVEDRLGRAPVAPGDQHHALRHGVDEPGLAEELRARHLRHHLVGQEQGDRLPAALRPRSSSSAAVADCRASTR